MIRLADLFTLIKEDSGMEGLDVKEQMDLQSYYYICEIMDINRVYPYDLVGNFSAKFTDDNKITHLIRILYQPLKVPRYDVKFGFFDENGKISFERPNIHYKLEADDKIFNTYIRIFLLEFLEKFFEKVKETNKLYLPATDYARYRLYRMALNKFLDKSKYKCYDDDHKNVIEKI
jgi:hypothetical protein